MAACTWLQLIREWLLITLWDAALKSFFFLSQMKRRLLQELCELLKKMRMVWLSVWSFRKGNQMVDDLHYLIIKIFILIRIVKHIWAVILLKKIHFLFFRPSTGWLLPTAWNLRTLSSSAVLCSHQQSFPPSLTFSCAITNEPSVWGFLARHLPALCAKQLSTLFKLFHDSKPSIGPKYAAANSDWDGPVISSVFTSQCYNI